MKRLFARLICLVRGHATSWVRPLRSDGVTDLRVACHRCGVMKPAWTAQELAFRDYLDSF